MSRALTGTELAEKIGRGFPGAVAEANEQWVTVDAEQLLAVATHRDAHGTGRGQMIDVALYESVLRTFHYHLAAYEKLGTIAERTGNMNPGQVPGDNLLTKDGKWVVRGAQGQRDGVGGGFAEVPPH